MLPMTTVADRVGVIVVRIWIEGSGSSVRARITRTLDIAARTEQSQLAVSEEQILDAVQEWIEAFVAEAS